MKVSINESDLTKIIAMIVEAFGKGDKFNKSWSDSRSREGSLGARTQGEGSFSGIEQTNDLNYVDKGRSTPDQREKWIQMRRRPNAEYYQNGSNSHLSAHMRHLQRLYGRRIKFFGYDNGSYIFFDLDNGAQKGYLLPGSLNSEYK